MGKLAHSNGARPGARSAGNSRARSATKSGAGWRWAAAGLALVGVGFAALPSRTPSTEAAPKLTSVSQWPEVVLAVGDPTSLAAQVVVSRPGQGGFRHWGRFQKRSGAVIKGRLFADGSQAALVVDQGHQRDRSWGSHLLLLAPGQPVKDVAAHLAHGSRPVVGPDGQLYVERGEAGAPPKKDAGHLRIDSWATLRVDPVSGQKQVVHSGHGYANHLIGFVGQELISYQVDASGGRFLALVPSSGKLRQIGKAFEPFARDFSLLPEAGLLVMQSRSQLHPDRWAVVQVNLATGAWKERFSRKGTDLVPFAVEKDSLLLNLYGRRLPSILNRPDFKTTGLPGGLTWVRARSADRRFVATLQLRDGALPVPALVDLQSGKGSSLPIPGGRAAVLGIVSGGAK